MADRTGLMRLITVGLTSTMVALAHGSAEAQLLGHGGPIRALSVAADGATALSGSFDTSAIRWSLRDNTAEQVLRFHQGAVDAVAMLADGRAATAGQDARIALWTPGKQAPTVFLKGIRGRLLRLRYRLMAPHSPRHPGIVRFVCGRSQAARPRCSRVISKASTELPLHRMAQQ